MPRGGTLVDDEPLLEKLAAICEIPGVMEGAFASDLAELPREVLTTSLRDHQSALTVEQEGRLLPLFLTVMDRPDDPAGRVRAGNEWVVAARLADARFFWGKDRSRPLAERSEALSTLTFQERLGSYAAKTERLVALAGSLAAPFGAERAAAERAAALAKVDLTTDMVREFTSLQGVIGGLYAREEGEPEAVWQAVYDQYLPAGADDPLPRGAAGRALALADRVDTLAGFFGLGKKLWPSGSRDPFGLRRAALGVVRLVLEGEAAVDLEAVFERAVALYGPALPAAGAEEARRALGDFLHDRVEFLLGRDGLAYDEIAAARGAAPRRARLPRPGRPGARGPRRAFRTRVPGRRAGRQADRQHPQGRRGGRGRARRRWRTSPSVRSTSRRRLSAPRSTPRWRRATSRAVSPPSSRSPRRSTASSSRSW